MSEVNVWLTRFAKLAVAATLCLIFIGGHTTTSGAGMAFPDWPLSHGSVNPNGWWMDFMQRLEHGHRLMAESVGLLVGILCAWVWRAKWAVPGAFGISITLTTIALLIGVPPKTLAHVGLWSSAIAFVVLLFAQASQDENPRPATVRWLAFGAFVGVLAQAVLGGLRVTVETSGDVSAATALRVIHGCFAQIELCLLVCVAGMLSPAPAVIEINPKLRGVSRLGWITVAVIFLQLIVGATMRHLGAGLVIPTFPKMPDGGWMPKVHNLYFDLNFTHTRFGAMLATVFVTVLAGRALASARGNAWITRPAVLLLFLIVAQFTMGMFVIWKLRPPILTTFHVVNGAIILATAVLLSLRASRLTFARAASLTEPVQTSMLQNASI